MKNIVSSEKLKIAIFGKTNSGKSSLFNAVLSQKMSIVSDEPGTTADPVRKALEIPGIGPCVLVDTAGFDDLDGELGRKRVAMTRKTVDGTDIAIVLLTDCDELELEWISFLKNGIRFMVIGNRARLDSALNEQIDECMRKTADCSNLSLVIFMSYSGRWDVLQAARRLALEAASDPARAEALGNMSADDFSRYLSTSGIPDPDLIIRTSGEVRLSNYLLWQCAYSELYFTDILWPDFREKEFDAALAEYAKRDRRYGKVK